MSNGQAGQPGEPGQPGTAVSGGAGGRGGTGGGGGTYGGTGGTGGMGGSGRLVMTSRYRKFLNILIGIVSVLVVFTSCTSVYLYSQLNNNAAEARQAAEAAVIKTETAQISAQRAAGAVTCRALVELDDTSHGIDFSKPTTPDKLYLLRYELALHHLVVVTGCEK
jgi:hypothetical protein